MLLLYCQITFKLCCFLLSRLLLFFRIFSPHISVCEILRGKGCPLVLCIFSGTTCVAALMLCTSSSGLLLFDAMEWMGRRPLSMGSPGLVLVLLCSWLWCCIPLAEGCCYLMRWNEWGDVLFPWDLLDQFWFCFAVGYGADDMGWKQKSSPGCNLHRLLIHMFTTFVAGSTGRKELKSVPYLSLQC